MPAQRRITSADNHKIFSRRAKSLGNFFMFGASFLLRKGAGVGKDKEHGIFFGEARRNARRRPIGVNGNIVDGLNAGRVVVKHDNFFVKILQRRLEFVAENFFDARNFGEQFAFQNL